MTWLILEIQFSGGFDLSTFSNFLDNSFFIGFSELNFRSFASLYNIFRHNVSGEIITKGSIIDGKILNIPFLFHLL